MRTIIAGSRDFNDKRILLNAINKCGWIPSVVISGDCRGADKLGAEWASWKSVPVEKFPAYWKEHGKAAGPIRNRLMADNAEALIAIWDGESRGTKNMIETARAKGLRVYVHMIEGDE
jgi:hypothetical protein